MARQSVERHHAEWLSLVETAGPFLTVPVLKRALPHGLEAVPPALPELRIAYAEWQDDPGLRRRWVRWVLDELLELRMATSEATDADPSYSSLAEPELTIRPSFVVRDATANGRLAVLLVHVVEAVSDRALDRAAELARASQVPLALVTDGERWTLVWARTGATTGLCTWRSEIWLQEPITLRAFVTLLGARRFFALPVQESLVELLQESADKQQEVTDRLGAQVRQAVELLIATLDRADRATHGALLAQLDDEEVYRGAVTVMMRLVFLFVAEDRRLLPIEDPSYAETLAASTLRAQLQERADQYGEEVLEHSTAAWHRLLALFRAVHGGVQHEALPLRAYGGGLFDPDRYPFLEGRPIGSAWHELAARPLPVDDRTVLHLLDALQTLDQGGKEGARVRLSFRALDVEQIGHVYEGLLDHTALRVSEPALAMAGRHEPELRLGELEAWRVQGEAVFVEALARATGRSARAVARLLDVEAEADRRARVRSACGNDDGVLARVLPYQALLRTDLRGDPLVFPAGSLFVTQALDRRSSGTYYTPRSLAEEVVQHALDPVAYEPGPAQTADQSAWRLRPAAELLDLKVADIAMGSGAFLVGACRYLARRLLSAWADLGDEREWTVFGRPRSEARDEQAIPADPQERELLAHRLVVERCLYGVDKNPMAVEMAKLSLWLITLAKGRPFSFVDHALRAGDSLVGVTSVAQLRNLHLDTARPRQIQLDFARGEIDRAVDRALELRESIERFAVASASDAEAKARRLHEAEEAVADARLLGDLVVGASLAKLEDADPLAGGIAAQVRTLLDPDADLTARALARGELFELGRSWLATEPGGRHEHDGSGFTDRHPFHWALEFPEVERHGGFDAIVGNPPFQGGQKITGSSGTYYRDYLVEQLAGGRRGSADLVAYFFLRAGSLLREGGDFGLIATNTVAQGDTREVGLDQLVERGVTFVRAVASEPWPGGANLEMATVWGRLGAWDGARILDGAVVGGITTSLALQGRVSGVALRVAANAGKSFQGSIVLGSGFVLAPQEAQRMLDSEPACAAVIKRFLNGEDLNSHPEGAPSRFVIDFQDWPRARAEVFREPFARVETRVHPERMRNNRPLYRERWWQFAERRPGLYPAIRGLDRCIAITLVSKVVQPLFVPTGIVYSHAVAVFAYDDDAHFGLLSSGFHWWWAVTHASTMRNDVRYTPTDCFETFAQPDLTPEVGRLGAALNEHRSALMLERQEGLTQTYNRVHDAVEQAADIVRLRELHVELDHAVRDAYGWDDLDLGHDFYDTRRFGVRYTFEPVARQEILDRLLELNHQRYAEEVARGLHDKSRRARRRSAAAVPDGVMTMDFDGV
jgi:hypothetical protein